MSGKKVLLLVQNFQPLHTQIITALEHQGYTVCHITDVLQPYNPYVSSCILKPVKRFLYRYRNPNRLYHKQFADIWDKKWDIFICIDGWSLEPDMILRLKKNNPDIKSILYLWDSLHYFNFSRLFPLFDRIFTFDPLDSKTYNISYLPLFWVEDNNNIIPENTKYDLSFVGKLHSDRFEFLNKIHDQCERLNLKTFFKLVIPSSKLTFKDYIKYLFIKSRKKHSGDYFLTMFNIRKNNLAHPIISRKYIAPSELDVIFQSSNCILDSEIPLQHGMTNRMMLGLSKKKKVITTNKWVLSDPIFKGNPNICVVNRDNPILDLDFIKTDYVIIPDFEEKIQRQRIDNWLNSLLM